MKKITTHAVEIPAEEAWLFEPENKNILAQVKEGLQQRGEISHGSFSQYLRKKQK